MPEARRATSSGHFKDAILEGLAKSGYNVAQFVSFEPGYPLTTRFVRLRGIDSAQDPEALVKALIESTGSVNVRSYDPEEPKSGEFVYGLTNTDEALAQIRRLAEDGLFTIVNETIDIHDGGISGVAYGDVFEFAPDDTPRCVEQPGTASLSTPFALRLFEKVYNVALKPSSFPTHVRLEFSIHPIRRGVADDHLIIWEAEEIGHSKLEPRLQWPNRFSRLVGDKTFGLMVADLIGLPVPQTTVLHRRLAPFGFGVSTGSSETWLRTAPPEPVPGLYTTQRGWTDPVTIWDEEKPAAILAQQGVDSKYAGAMLVNEDGDVVIEGSKGNGDAFMLGTAAPAPLPTEVVEGVMEVCDTARSYLGPVRMEWGFDGRQVWVFQLHRGATPSTSSVVFPGEAEEYHRFDVSEGIVELRKLVERVEGTGLGIVLVGDVGVTSHLGDILRRAAIPSRVEFELN